MSALEKRRQFLSAMPDALRGALGHYAEYLCGGGQPGAYGTALYLKGELPFNREHVPPLLWPADYESRFRLFFGGLDVLDRTARAALSVLLLSTIRPLPRPVLGAELGYGVRYVNGGIARAIQWAQSQAGFEAEWAAYLRSLRSREFSIDYRQRRAVLQDFVVVPWAEWTRLCEAAGASRGRPGGRNTYAAAWLWGHLMDAEPLYSPAAERMTRRHSSRHVATVFHAFQTRHLASVQGALEDWGEAFLREAERRPLFFADGAEGLHAA